jgi:hypothetical protein
MTYGIRATQERLPRSGSFACRKAKIVPDKFFVFPPSLAGTVKLHELKPCLKL